jgi:hypothetical protein
MGGPLDGFSRWTTNSHVGFVGILTMVGAVLPDFWILDDGFGSAMGWRNWGFFSGLVGECGRWLVARFGFRDSFGSEGRGSQEAYGQEGM